jgi:hypothetical protein
MTQLCLITGTVVDRGGDPIASTDIVVTSRQRVVSGGVLLVPSVETFTTNASGEVSMQLYTGYYTAEITYEGTTHKFSLGVPDKSTASFNEVIALNTVIASVIEGPMGPPGAEVIVSLSTDNVIVRYDATLGQLKNSGVTIDDNGKVTINGQGVTDLEIVSVFPTILFEDTSSGSKALIGTDEDGSLYLTADRNEDAPGNPFVYFTVAGTSAMSIDAAGHMRVGDETPPTVTAEFAGTDAILLPVGDTSERPTETEGYFRYNSETEQAEVADGSDFSRLMDSQRAVVKPKTASWSGTESLDPANGLVQVITLTGDVTTLTDDLEDGEFVTMLIDDGTDYDITWPTATWLSDGGSEVVLQTSGVTRVDALKVGSTLYLTAINGV